MVVDMPPALLLWSKKMLVVVSVAEFIVKVIDDPLFAPKIMEETVTEEVRTGLFPE